MTNRLFPSQLDTETIFLVVREHWVRLILKIALWLFLALALVFFEVYGPTYTPVFFTEAAQPITTIFTQVYTLFLILSLFIIWILYYLNIQVITSLRIVDISQEGLFSHVISELHIDKIEDVTSEVDGILGTMFDYGMVFIQTAGTLERFEFSHVPHPAQIEKLVLTLYEKNSNFAKEGNESDPSLLTHN
jgi:hypothetical protein